MNPQIITIENVNYYVSNEVYVIDPAFFPGCQINMRLIIEKKNLSPNDYIFAYVKNEKWVVSTMKYARAKLLLTTEWVENNVPKMIINMRKNNISLNKSIEKVNDTVEDVNDLYDAPPAPVILHLEDEEMFKDNKGNCLDIEVRGQRDHKKCYFKVKDVSIAFDMPNLYTILLHKDKGYVNELHYKYFTNTILTIAQKDKTKKELYLTYKGLLKVLYSSRSGNAESFQDWAEETLFAVQMGTPEQTDNLISKIKGVSYDTIQELFSINAREMPCVYLTALNTVEVLRDEMKIDMCHPDDAIVYKYGKTGSFAKRKNGHNQEYKKLDHLIDKKLVYYTIIDPLYIAKAETELSSMMEDYKIRWDSHDELVIITKEQMKNVKLIYENVGIKFSGHTSSFNVKIQEIEMKLLSMQSKHETELKLKDKDIEILKKDHELKLKDKDTELKLKEKDNELLLKEIQFKEREIELLNRLLK